MKNASLKNEQRFAEEWTMDNASLDNGQRFAGQWTTLPWTMSNEQ